MKKKDTAQFDPKVFLAQTGKGRALADHVKNHTIFLQGEPADAVFYIHKGKIKLTVVSKQGKEAVVALLGPGDFFGEGCLAGQPLRMASATTMSECSIMRLEKTGVIHMLHSEPAFSATFALRKIWWINSSTPAKSAWRECCCCWPTSARKANRSW
jgi:CRP-like cAMP-binding protein